jgi:hypothetical protein
MKRIIMILLLVVFSSSYGSDSKKVDSSSGNDNQIEDGQKRMSINPEDLEELLSKKHYLRKSKLRKLFQNQ